MQEKIIRFFLNDQLTEKAARRKGPGTGDRSKELAYVFIGAADPALAKSCRSYSTLLKIASGDIHGMPVVYWKPNTFYRGDKPLKANLRWLNALVLDIDEEGLCILDIFDRVRVAGLPEPTLINQTPHGWHVYWSITPARATTKAIALYEALIKAMIRALEGADPNCFSAEKYFRIPANVKHFSEVRYTLSDFIEWRDINEPDPTPPKSTAKIYYISKCLSQPGIREIHKGADDGCRDNSAFTLALAYYKDGFTADEALAALRVWNQDSIPALSESILQSKVKSAYSGRYKGPSDKYVHALTGIHLRYRPITPAKPREERQRDHLSEIREDIIKYIRNNGGRVELTQKAFAEVLDVAIRSFKAALKTLRSEGLIVAYISGAGRARQALYAILEAVADVVRDRLTKGNPWSNQYGIITQFIQDVLVHTDIHPMGEVVGGCPSRPPFSLSPYLCNPKRGGP